MSRMSELSIELQESGMLTEDPVVNRVIERLFLRSKAGMLDYGTTMQDNQLTTVEWIDHAIEEALDFANYLERLRVDVVKLESLTAIMEKDLGIINDVQA